jgi:hypothetical protein
MAGLRLGTQGFEGAADAHPHDHLGAAEVAGDGGVGAFVEDSGLEGLELVGGSRRASSTATSALRAVSLMRSMSSSSTTSGANASRRRAAASTVPRR